MLGRSLAGLYSKVETGRFFLTLKKGWKESAVLRGSNFFGTGTQ